MNMDEMITKVWHIGIIVKDIEKTIGIFKNLFALEDGAIDLLPLETTLGESRYAFLSVAGMELELIQPISERFREMLGNPADGINHIAFVVKDIEESVSLLEKKGIPLGHVTKDGILDMGRAKIAYLDPRSTDNILIELVEPNE